MVIYNAQIYTQTDRGIISQGSVVIEEGKIVAVLEETPVSVGAGDFDAAGDILLPGFIDAHTHLGIIENGVDFEGDDCNEATDPFMPRLRAIDGINPFDFCFSEARAAGVTTVMVSPGSANACGGQMSIIKTAGKVVDKMQIGTAMKFALGENPKNVYRDRDETPITRMGTASLIREGLAKAKRYGEDCAAAVADPDRDMPEYDADCEALQPVLRREVKAHFHCHRADDICTAMRIAREFDLDLVIIHGTEGYLVADELAMAGVPVIAGPMLCDRCKPEMQHLTVENPARMAAAGVSLALCTDHPVIPVQYLKTTAKLSIGGGLDRATAMRTITCDAADILGIGQRVGRIATGYDADLQLYHGDPLDLLCNARRVWIDGECVAGECVS